MDSFALAYQDSGAHVSVAAGITIGLVASFVQSLGLTIQRKSHVLNQEAPESAQRVEHRRPLWLLGFTIFISSNILGSIFQIASLPVVILAPLGAVSLLWNALFARFILGDLFSRYMVIGTLLIVAGAVLIARFGIVPEPTHSLEDLLALFTRDTFVIYFSLLGAAVVIALAVTHIMEWSVKRRITLDTHSLSLPSSPMSPSPINSPIPLTPTPATERTPLLLGRDATASPSPSVSSTVITATPSKYASTFNLIAVCYASVSGILSGMCLLFAKSGVELLLLTLAGHNQFWRWESWALVGGLVVFALLQLWYLHKSLILADPTLVCPLAFCFYNLSSIVNGLVYYDQLDVLSPTQLGLVTLGIVVLLVGVWAVSIQTDDDVEEADSGARLVGVREGDWINADEEGVAPAIAPADAVRVLERVTGTLPDNAAKLQQGHQRRTSKDDSTTDMETVVSPSIGSTTLGPRKSKKDLHLSLGRRSQTTPTSSPRSTRVISSPTPIPTSSTTVFPSTAGDDEEYHVGHTSPSASPLTPHVQSRGWHADSSPLLPSPYTRGRNRSQHSARSPTALVPAGFSIGLSAVSPGFGVPATRRRSDVPIHGEPRRSMSMSDARGLAGEYDPEGEGLMDEENEREAPRKDRKNGESHEGGSRWGWFKAAWKWNRRKPSDEL